MLNITTNMINSILNSFDLLLNLIELLFIFVTLGGVVKQINFLDGIDKKELEQAIQALRDLRNKPDS